MSRADKEEHTWEPRGALELLRVAASSKETNPILLLKTVRMGDLPSETLSFPVSLLDLNALEGAVKVLRQIKDDRHEDGS